jgi:hypothetical protein
MLTTTSDVAVRESCRSGRRRPPARLSERYLISIA